MKLDLLARFSELQTFIRPQVPHAEARGRLGDFGSLLQSQSPDIPEDSRLLTDEGTAVPEPLDTLPAQTLTIPSLMPKPQPELVIPRIDAVLPDQTSDTQEPESVNVPALLEASRVSGGVPRHSGNAEGFEAVEQLVKSKSQSTQVTPSLALGVISAESSFNPRAVSSDGYESKGLFQLLDSTGKQWMRERFPDRTYDPFDPELNVELGISHLDYLHSIFSTETALTTSAKTFPAEDSSSLKRLAVAAFNAGEGRVASAQRRAERAGRNPSRYDDIAAYLPETTRTYVSRVIDFERQFAASAALDGTKYSG